jgi:hypothetical protein
MSEFLTQELIELSNVLQDSVVGESQADRDETLPGKFSSADDLFNALGV